MTVKSISNKKKILFWLILILLPVAILALLEIVFNLLNYGGNLDIFVLNNAKNKNEYIFNENFTNRYFFQKGIKTPTPLSQSFSADKKENTYRIFCLGASTTQGFPYPANNSFPAYLKNILTKVHPSKNIEVINCGVTAITSLAVLDMESEILEKYSPDLIIVYTGHNEFYGVLGQGSRLSLFENRTLLKTFLALQKSRLFLAVRDLINNLIGTDYSKETGIDHNTFMELVAEDRNINITSDLFSRTENQFRENIIDLVKNAKESKVDILLCNLVSNKKDLEPFGSFSIESNLPEINNKLEKASQLEENKKFDEAIIALNIALWIDTTYAQTNYKLAQDLDSLKDYTMASKYFNRATDYDVIRFRAPSSFNKIIENVSKEFKVPLVDVEKSFIEASPRGIIGKELILEHVHPNQNGYLLIAKSIAEKMLEKKLIGDDWNLLTNISEEDYQKMTFLTPLSKEVINYMIYKLTSNWPYKFNNQKYIRIENERTEELAKSLIIDEQGSLVELHIKYGEELQKAKQYGEALDEYKAALNIEPLSVLYDKIGRLYLALTEINYRSGNAFKQANEYFSICENYYKEGLEKYPDDLELNFNLGLLYFMRNDRLAESVERYTKVLELDPKHKKALSKLSELYFRQNELTKAEQLLEEAIKYYPKDARFYTDLGLVYYQQKNSEAAKEFLNKAITMNNDLKAKYFLEKINNNNL